MPRTRLTPRAGRPRRTPATSGRRGALDSQASEPARRGERRPVAAEAAGLDLEAEQAQPVRSGGGDELAFAGRYNGRSLSGKRRWRRVAEGWRRPTGWPGSARRSRPGPRAGTRSTSRNARCGSRELPACGRMTRSRLWLSSGSVGHSAATRRRPAAPASTQSQRCGMRLARSVSAPADRAAARESRRCRPPPHRARPAPTRADSGRRGLGQSAKPIIARDFVMSSTAGPDLGGGGIRPTPCRGGILREERLR